jgi:hypothetical protein
MSKEKILNKIKDLEKQQKEIANKIEELKNKKDKKEKENEDKKKIIIGSYFLNKYTKENKVDELVELLSEYLLKKRERKLFDLKN